MNFWGREYTETSLIAPNDDPMYIPDENDEDRSDWSALDYEKLNSEKENNEGIGEYVFVNPE